MDETPEELEQIRREAEAIDVNKYRKRHRLVVTALALAFCGAVVWVALRMVVAARNPCERVADYFCRKAFQAEKCKDYGVILDESTNDPSPEMRGVIRDQCLTKIRRMKSEDGITIE